MKRNSPRDLFGHRHRSQHPDNFNLGEDMSPVERSFLADSLVERYERDHPGESTAVYRGQTDRFRFCGHQGSRLICPSCQIPFYTRFFCKFRLCDTCSRIYGKEIRDKIIKLITPIFAKKKRGWTIALLTLSESKEKYRGRYPNREEYQRFNRHVSEFCRLFYGKYKGGWSKKGKIVERRSRFQGAGWFAVNEFGDNNTNLHSHLLLYGPWVPHKKLLAAWARITGGDTGCHIEPIADPHGAGKYISKYITKAPRFLNPLTAIDFVVTTKSQRRIRSGGIFYNSLKRRKPERTADLCPFCVVELDYQGTVFLTETGDGLNLPHIRKNRELYETEELREIVNSLPGGALPCNLPYYPSLASF